MRRLLDEGNGAIKSIFLIGFILLAGNIYSQGVRPELIGKSFIALNASNADSTARWYEEMFGVKLLKEIKVADGSGHIRIEGNQFLMVEIIQAKGSRTFSDCQLQKGQSHLLRGYFKAGIFVTNIEKAEKYFQSKGASIPHRMFSDKETAMKSFIVEDPNGNLLQFIQETNAEQAK